MSTIFLTSTGLSDEATRLEFMKHINTVTIGECKVAIITTAAEGKSENKYAKLARSQFQEMGFSDIRFFDVEFDNPEILNSFQVIYVCGGNTFFLLHHLKKSGAGEILKNILLNKKDVIYVGVSAGSIILSPTIKEAATINPDPNDIGLTDWNGLGVIDFEAHVHYDPEDEEEILAYEKSVSQKIIRIANGQSVLVSEGNILRIG
jgi:dipeptidase E